MNVHVQQQRSKQSGLMSVHESPFAFCFAVYSIVVQFIHQQYDPQVMISMMPEIILELMQLALVKYYLWSRFFFHR